MSKLAGIQEHKGLVRVDAMSAGFPESVSEGRITSDRSICFPPCQIKF